MAHSLAMCFLAEVSFCFVGFFSLNCVISFCFVLTGGGGQPELCAKASMAFLIVSCRSEKDNGVHTSLSSFCGSGDLQKGSRSEKKRCIFHSTPAEMQERLQNN